MPGKVNPVIPEAVSQAAMRAMGNDGIIAMACAQGSLELNPFLPLVAECLLENIDLLTRADEILRRFCVDGLEADEERCRSLVENSTAIATALLPALGYERTCGIAHEAAQNGRTIRQVVVEQGLLSEAEFDACISSEAVCRLGHPMKKGRAVSARSPSTVGFDQISMATTEARL